MPRKTKAQLAAEAAAIDPDERDTGSAVLATATDSPADIPESSPPADPPEMILTVLENSQVFKWNFDEIKTRLLAGIEKYAGLVVTEENLPEMEKTQREIASLRTQVNKFRIDTKKQLTATADQFDGEVKELTAIITAAEAPLKKQIEEYEVVRVQKAETDLLQFAWKYASGLGMRSAIYETYQVPSKLTQRGTSDKTAKTEVVAAMDLLMEGQRSADKAAAEKIRLEEEAVKAATERRALIGILCESRSAEAGLKTPLTREEFERCRPLASVMGLDELPGQISREIQHRLEIEQAAARAAETKRMGESVRVETPPPSFGPPAAAQATPAPPSGPPPAVCRETVTAMPNNPEKLWDVTLKFRCTNAQATMLKPMFAQVGLKYETVSCLPVEGVKA